MNSQEAFTPPHSGEAEQSVIGALLMDNNAIDRIGELLVDDFYSMAHRDIFSAIQNQSALGRQFDVITIAEALQSNGRLDNAGGLAYIGGLAANVPSSANIARYASIVKEHSQRRKIISAANELSALIYSKADIGEAMDKAQSQLIAITETVKTDEPRSMAQIVHEHFSIIERRMEGATKGITTGIDDLDEILNGGWHRGQIIVLAARPSMGKTALSMHHGIKAAMSGYGVLYLSMEMVASELADRAISSIGRISLKNVLTAKMKEAEWEGMTLATSKLNDLPLHVLDKSGLTFYQVATYARRHKRKYGLDVLVIDYLQLMAGAEGDKRHSQIEEITRNLKSLAKELNIAIILLSQLSRKTEDSRKPKLSHLRDSGSIEQDADIVLFIHREEVDNPETEWKNYADIHIAKNRQGALGRVGVTYIGEQVRFEQYSGRIPNWEDNKPKRGGFD